MNRSEATEGVSGNPFPVPHRGCPVGTGGKRISARSAKRPKGFRGIPSPCPTGAVPQGLGVECQLGIYLLCLLLVRDDEVQDNSDD